MAARVRVADVLVLLVRSGVWPASRPMIEPATTTKAPLTTLEIMLTGGVDDVMARTLCSVKLGEGALQKSAPAVHADAESLLSVATQLFARPNRLTSRSTVENMVACDVEHVPNYHCFGF